MILSTTQLLIMASLFHLVCLVFLCIPHMMDWNFDNGHGDNLESTNILRSMASTKYRDALVANVSISLVLLVDVLFEVVSSSKKMQMLHLLRAALLLGVALPDIAILFWVSHSGAPQLLMPLYEFKVVVIFFVGQLISYFTNSKLFLGLLMPSILINVSGILRSYLSFQIANSQVFYIGFFVTHVCALLFTLRATLSVGNSDNPDQQYEFEINRAYYRALVGALCSKLIIVCIFGPAINGDSTSLYLALQSYPYIIFSTSSWLRLGALVRDEASKAKASLNMKRVFVRYVSHEIRTPLNTVLMGIRLLKDEMTRVGKDMNKLTDIVLDIEISCDAAIHILNGLLDYEKLESGIMKLEKSKIPLWPFLRDSVRPFQIQARQAGVTLSICNEEESSVALQSYALYGDQHKLCQVLRNCISNALKFTPRGGSVTIKATVCIPESYYLRRNGDNYRVNPDVESVVPCSRVGSVDSRESYIRVQVIDTGHGIAPQNLPKVFNEIVQFNAGELQNGGGSGLGLWISKSIVEMHGGAVSVHSEGEGRGCTFTIELPIIRDHQSSSTNVDRLSVAGVEHTWLNQGTKYETSVRSQDVAVDTSFLNILIVDDADLNRKMLSRLIGGRFKTVTEAEDGRRALEMVREAMGLSGNVPDIILMDFIMPHMDGPTATREIRSLGYKGLIIGVTGNALPADTESFLTHGANRVLVKPLRVEVLDKTIADLSHRL